MAAALQVDRHPAGFFRVILPCFPYEKEMDLPLKFVVVYGADLSSTATFNLPDGSVWKIGVNKGPDGRSAWFSENWGRFVDHHSISIGFFLVFQYLGSSEFKVKIFDLSCCSISYPLPSGNSSEQSGRGRAQAVSPNQVVSPEDEDGSQAGEVETLLKRVNESGIAKGRKFARTISKFWMKSKKGVEEAILCKPHNRPCFLMLMTCALIKGKSMVSMPSAFVAEHIEDGWTGVKLQVQQGKKQWDVNLNRVRGTQMRCMDRGWKGFSNDNGLGVGDVCLFQLVSPVEPVLEVAVFPAEK
ncbi:unnamed protein product [Linum tenue]|uniref:TF-B3 domain-containing protein n=1 Tax=Linum tenue TaxID=586396 RepID=A0AAV0MMY7_9ROSI|nr:unnamed protein product [Linum tenue]CAI0446923.1 unnamed protein product [Linum tenue]